MKVRPGLKVWFTAVVSVKSRVSWFFVVILVVREIIVIAEMVVIMVARILNNVDYLQDSINFNSTIKKAKGMN